MNFIKRNLRAVLAFTISCVLTSMLPIFVILAILDKGAGALGILGVIAIAVCDVALASYWAPAVGATLREIELEHGAKKTDQEECDE